MAINFPKEEGRMSPTDTFMAYKQLVDYHLCFLQQKSKSEFFYSKGLGDFLFAHYLSAEFYLVIKGKAGLV